MLNRCKEYGGAACFTMGGSAIGARSVEGHTYVSTGRSAVGAMRVGGAAFVSRDGSTRSACIA